MRRTMAAAAPDQRRDPRCRSYQSHLPARAPQAFLDELGIIQEGHPGGTPRWKGEVLAHDDGTHTNIKVGHALLEDPRWFSPPAQVVGGSPWRSTDYRHGDPHPSPGHGGTVHKAVVFVAPMRHPRPVPVAPMVLVRALNDKSVDIPGGTISVEDQELATEHGTPEDFALLAMYCHIVEETNLHPTEIAPMLDEADRPITVRGSPI